MVFLVLILVPVLSWAAPCVPGMKAGDKCDVAVSKLRPTQPEVGFVDVNEKRRILKGLKGKKRAEYLKKNRIAVVIGPGGEVFIVDGHHRSRAALLEGVGTMRADVMDDLSELSPKKFWKKMEKRGWVRFRDQNGFELGPDDLPRKVAGLVDDPYRSLAWVMLKSDAIDKTKIPFAEYEWADYFRARITNLKDWDGAVKEAIRLATLSYTSGLPGHVPIAPKYRIERREECWARFVELGLPKHRP